MSVQPTFIERARRAAPWPFLYAFAFGAWVLLGYFLTGGANIATLRANLLAVLLWYLAAALSVTLLIALLGPWAISRLRGAILGGAISLPLSLSVNYGLVAAPLRGLKLLVFLGMLALVLGAPLGAMYWRPPR